MSSLQSNSETRHPNLLEPHLRLFIFDEVGFGDAFRERATLRQCETRRRAFCITHSNSDDAFAYIKHARYWFYITQSARDATAPLQCESEIYAAGYSADRHDGVA